MYAPGLLCSCLQSVCLGAILTVFLVHQDLKRIHLIVVKSQPNFLTCVLICELSVHKAERKKKRKTQSEADCFQADFHMTLF